MGFRFVQIIINSHDDLNNLERCNLLRAQRSAHVNFSCLFYFFVIYTLCFSSVSAILSKDHVTDSCRSVLRVQAICLYVNIFSRVM